MAASDLPIACACEDAHDFMRKVQNCGRRGWIFRGHADSDNWRLTSSLHRFLKEHGDKIKESSWYVREKGTIRRFRNVAHLHLRHLPPGDDNLSWLALMQHYGSPTRLLDFTFNPTVALYFAVCDTGPGKGPFCVHALHLDSIRKRSRKVRMSVKENGKKKKIDNNPAPEEYGIGERSAEKDFVGGFEGHLANERLAAQEGLFLVPSRIDLDFETWLREFSSTHHLEPFGGHWVKFCFQNQDRESYYTVVKQMMHMGMSPVRLFPGLEGLCESFRFAWLEVVKDLDPPS